MDAQSALGVFYANLPETGAVPYEEVYNAMQASSEGRKALERFHDLRRSKTAELHAKRVKVGDARVLMVSRQPFPDESEG